VGPTRRPIPQLGLLSWGSSIPLCQHCPCVHSHLDRRPDFGPELPRSEHVPFLPFLPAPTVFSAEVQSEDQTLDSPQVCCTLQPALGFTTFPILWSAFRLPATRRSWTRRSGESSSVADTLRSFPLLGSLTMPSPRHTLSDVLAFTGWRALPPFRVALACVSPRCAARPVDLRALFHRGVRCVYTTLPSCIARCSHGLWINTFRCCHAAFYVAPPCVPKFRWMFRPAVPTAVASPEPSVEGRQRVSALSGSEQPMLVSASEDAAPAGLVRWQPEDCYASSPARPIPRRERSESVAIGSGVSRRRHLGRASSRPRRVQRNASGQSRGKSTAPVRLTRRCSVSGSSHRHSEEWHRDPALSPGGLAPAVRAPSVHPSAVARIHDDRIARRRLTPPEGGFVGASLARVPKESLRRTLLRDPRRNRISKANRVATRKWIHSRLVTPAQSPASWSGRSRARQSSSSSKRPRPKSPPRPEGR
jgi:hypothetical protein